MVKKVVIEEEEVVETVEEFLARGGKIEVCEPGARTADLVVGQWGRGSGPKKKAPTPLHDIHSTPESIQDQIDQINANL
jgi:hypothetical protein